MNKYRARETRYSDGHIEVVIQKKVLWWWENLYVMKGGSISGIKTRMLVVDEDRKSIKLQLDKADSHQIKSILEWLSMSKKHVCLYDTTLHTFVFGILIEGLYFSYRCSPNLCAMLEYEKEMEKENQKPDSIHKTQVIDWKLIEDGFEDVEKNVVWKSDKI